MSGFNYLPSGPGPEKFLDVEIEIFTAQQYQMIIKIILEQQAGT